MMRRVWIRPFRLLAEGRRARLPQEGQTPPVGTRSSFTASLPRGREAGGDADGKALFDRSLRSRKKLRSENFFEAKTATLLHREGRSKAASGNELADTAAPGEGPIERVKLLSTELKRCTTAQEAFEAYIRHREKAIEADRVPFEPSMWHNHILRNFLRLYSIPTTTTSDPDARPLSEMLTVMLQDMYNFRAAEAKTYNEVLDHIAKKRSDNSIPLIELRQSVIAVHQCLLQEPEDERQLHSIHNITALMNAYNHTGLSQSALEIWTRLVMNRKQVTPITVSVIFDTCAFAGRLGDARRIFAYVTHPSRVNQLMSKGAWDAYIECLARCNRVRQAIEAALFEMGPALQKRRAYHEEFGGESPQTHKQEEVLGPDEKTVKMLLRFAVAKRDARYGSPDLTIVDDFCDQLETHYPDLWQSMQQLIASRRVQRANSTKWRSTLYNTFF